MTEREQLHLLADALDVQIEEILPQIANYPREFQFAMQRLEEASMWVRRAIERMK